MVRPRLRPMFRARNIGEGEIPGSARAGQSDGPGHRGDRQRGGGQAAAGHQTASRAGSGAAAAAASSSRRQEASSSRLKPA